MSPLSVHDLHEIQNLVATYCLATDNADVEAFMSCWVEPAEFGGYNSGAFGNLTTWQELREFEQHHVGPGGMANGKRHLSLNLHIEGVSASEALVTHDLVVLEVAAIPHIVASGRYNRNLAVKTPAGWRFKSRSLEVDSGFFKLVEQSQAV